MDNPSIPPTQPHTGTTSQLVFSPTHLPSDAPSIAHTNKPTNDPTSDKTTKYHIQITLLCVTKKHNQSNNTIHLLLLFFTMDG